MWLYGRSLQTFYRQMNPKLCYTVLGARQYVRRPVNSEYNREYITKTVKHGWFFIMIWRYFSFYGIGPIYWIKGRMDRTVHGWIMQEVMVPLTCEEMPLLWVFQRHSDPKQTSKLAQQLFQKYSVKVMDWPAQSPDLNPVEKLWYDVKEAVANANPTNNK